MMNWLKYSLVLCLLTGLLACQSSTKTKSGDIATRPQAGWLKNAVIYEVNIRQYTPQGTFNAFAKSLPRLKKLGVTILWLMPVNPISVKNRKGSLGSYYAVKNYKKINPEFGTLDDFKNLVNEAHQMGFKVIIDWVANHTGWDNSWIYSHPEWYKKDSTGAICSPDPDWTDVAGLNYAVVPMRRAMISAMKYWLKTTDIDGFRCDAAWGVPQDFWEEARASLDSIKPVYMLAEDEDHPGFLKKAFESDYAWKFYHLMNDVAEGKKEASVFRTYFNHLGARYARGSFPMQFITNHDENSWTGTVRERLGKAADAFSVLYFTVPGIPLIYSGQEAGLSKRLRFFDKDTINWSDLSKQGFYRSLIQLKTENAALWNGSAGGSLELLSTSDNTHLFAFRRRKGSNEVMVILNLSDREIKGTVKANVPNGFTEWNGTRTLPVGKNVVVKLGPWNYKIYSCR